MQEKGIILSMWGWGYTLTQMPGGTLTIAPQDYLVVDLLKECFHFHRKLG